MTPRRLAHTLVLCLLALPALAKAHYLWIETEAGEARIYFGEFNEGLRERAGGRLDERSALQAWLEPPAGPRQPLQLVKKGDHFAATSAQGQGWLVTSDLTSEVKDYRKQEIGIVKPMFYARAALGNAPPPERPSLELDLLPLPTQPGAFRVFLAGKPLAGAKVFVYAPNLWMRELVSDEHGQVRPPTPWPGRYVLDITHKEAKPGEYRGQPYAAVRHRMTFSFVAP